MEGRSAMFVVVALALAGPSCAPQPPDAMTEGGDMGGSTSTTADTDEATTATDTDTGEVDLDSMVIAFHDQETLTIVLTDIGGGSFVDLVDGLLPMWSPDGSEIAFFSRDEGGVQDLFVVDVATLELVQLTDFRSPNTVRQAPRYSPSGATIGAAVLTADGGQVVFLDRTSGSPLVYTDGRDPAFCGDFQVLYTRDPPGDGTQIVRSSLRAFHPIILVDDGSNNASPVCRGQDTVVFVSDRAGSCELFEVDVGGGPVTQLTDRPDLDCGAFDERPVISPDRKEAALVLRSLPDGRDTVVVVDLDSGAVEQPVENFDSIRNPPSWSPDGQYLVYAWCTDPTCTIARLAPAEPFQAFFHRRYGMAPAWRPTP